MAKQFFYKIGDDTIGPLNGQQLRDAVARGEVQQDTLIQVEGGPTVPANKIRGLFGDSGLSSKGRSESPKNPVAGDEVPADLKKQLPSSSGEPQSVEDALPNPSEHETESQATSSPRESDWHYLTKKKQVGPVSLTKIYELIQMGSLKGDSLVWHETLDGWAAVSSVPDFAVFIGESPKNIDESSKKILPPPAPDPSFVSGEMDYRERNYGVLLFYSGFNKCVGIIGLFLSFIALLMGVSGELPIAPGVGLVAASFSCLVIGYFLQGFVDLLKDTQRQRYDIGMLTRYMMRSSKD